MPWQLERVLEEIHRAFQAKLYYAALTIALTLPDICVGLTLDDEDFVKKQHYVGFVEQYAPIDLTGKRRSIGMTGEDCYHIRCGLIHRGNAAGNPFFDVTHVIFTTPETGRTFHGFGMHTADDSGRAAFFDVESFCAAMEDAVRRWYLANRTNPKVQANLSRMLSHRPFGVPPFVVGGPVIASGT
jgi:hypothetical protein